MAGGIGERLPEGGPVPPHGHVPGVALDDVYRRVPAVRVVVVSRREVHEQRPLVRVIERVTAQQFAADDVLVDAAGEIRGPGQHGFSLAELLRDPQVTEDSRSDGTGCLGQH
jgi:hypothetical protein